MQKQPFLLRAKSKEIHESLIHVVKNLIDSEMSNYVCMDSAQRYYHGEGWINTHGYKNGEETELKEISGYAELSYEDVVWYNVQAFNEFVQTLANSMSGEAIKDIFQTVSEACEESGNIVLDDKKKDFKDKFLELIQKVDLFVDDNGDVNMPQLHVSSSMHDDIMKEISEPDEKFNEKVEGIKKEKIAEAKKREKERLSKYKGVLA